MGESNKSQLESQDNMRNRKYPKTHAGSYTESYIAGYVSGFMYFKTALRIANTQSVIQRIHGCAYRTGLMTSAFIKRALEYAITHEAIIKQAINDPAIWAFLTRKEIDCPTFLTVRVSPRLAVKIEKGAERLHLSRQDFMNIAIAYYAIYVAKAIKVKQKMTSNPLSQETQSLPQ